MENKGIQFYYKDGTTEWYDPISDYVETETEYTFYVLGYSYNISKEKVKDYRVYNLCEKCGHEDYEVEGCVMCAQEDELNRLKNE